MVPVQYEAGNGRDKEGIGSSFLKPKTKPKKEKLVSKNTAWKPRHVSRENLQKSNRITYQNLENPLEIQVEAHNDVKLSIHSRTTFKIL